MHVATTKMFFQILLARKSVAGAAVAVRIWAHQRFPRIHVLLVDFALVPKQATGIREALDLIAAWLKAFVGAIMFIHVFTVAKTC